MSIIGALFESVGGCVPDLQYHFDPHFSPSANLDLCGTLLGIGGSKYLGSVALEDLQCLLSTSQVLSTGSISLSFLNQLQWRCGIVFNHTEFDT